MERSEMMQILATIDTAYPNFLRGRDPQRLAGLWCAAFSNYTAEQVGAAVLAYVTTETSGFAPTIGQIKEKLDLAVIHNQMDESTAWALVYKAIMNGLYNSRSEFEKLPPEVQRCVGSHEQLRAWAEMDVDEVQTVIASQFKKSFRSRAEHNQTLSRLPDNCRDILLGMVANIGHPGVLSGGALPGGDGNRNIVQEA